MWIYLIIAAELGLFYTLFWFYFVREPQPFKVKGNPWGAYDELTTGGVEPTAPFITDLSSNAYLPAPQTSLPSTSDADRKEQAQIRLARRRRNCRKAAMSRAHLPAELFDRDQHRQPVFKRLLSMLGFSAAVS
jgi:hypothetical protein